MARGQIRAFVALVVATLLGATQLHAESPKWRDALHHNISVEVRPAYNIVSHYAMRPEGKPLNSTLSFHARYSFSFSPESRIGELFPNAYQGIGIASYTYFNHELMGSPMAVYILQGAEIGEIVPRLTIGYEWNLGFSWGWHANEAMNSPRNVLINVALPLAWHITDSWILSLTPDYTHFSNGDTSFANAGSNLFGVRLGATYNINGAHTHATARRYISPSAQYSEKSFAQRMTYDIVAYGGWRADRFMDSGKFYVINKAFPLGGIHLQPIYHLNDHFGVGASLDIQADSSLNLYGAEIDPTNGNITYSRPPLWQQLEAGISVRGEISAPIFTLGIGLGYNLLDTGYDASHLYTTFSLKAHITRQLFLYIGYRFNSTQYTHNLMYGIGIRL